jgi:MYXO-CTERM domain-containing protein
LVINPTKQFPWKVALGGVVIGTAIAVVVSLTLVRPLSISPPLAAATTGAATLALLSLMVVFLYAFWRVRRRRV